MRYVRLNPDGTVRSYASAPDQEHTTAVSDGVEVGWIQSGSIWVDPKAEEKRIASIKFEAGKLITERYPAWKQNNLTAQAVEAILNYLLTLPGTEEAKENLTNSILGLGAWTWVKQVRAESDRLEGDPNATPNWPQ